MIRITDLVLCKIVFQNVWLVEASRAIDAESFVLTIALPILAVSWRLIVFV